jgi:hypothetical protein
VAFPSDLRVGSDAGDPTRTYGCYRYALFGTTRTKYLVIRFGRNGRVADYSFATIFPEEKRRRKTGNVGDSAARD